MSMKDWSTTPASNATVGSISWAEGMPPSQVNDSARQEMADVRYELATQDTIASASTTDLGSKDAGSLTVSGTTTITSFGTVSAGIRKLLTFSGALTLTHNGTSLILPGAANITTVAGDSCVAESLGSGNWKVHSYQAATVTGTGATVRATSPTLVTPALGTPASGVLTNCTGTAAGLTAGTASAVAVGGITGLGTGVATALAVNVGSAGAPVTFNGALGTPSSGTVTNLTGTANININGTVGATTPSTVAATTGAFSDRVEVSKTTNATINDLLRITNGGVSNGVGAKLSLWNGAEVGYLGWDYQSGDGNYRVNLNSTGLLRFLISGSQVARFDASGMNGALGATTPSTVAATTGSFSGAVTVTRSANDGSTSISAVNANAGTAASASFAATSSAASLTGYMIGGGFTTAGRYIQASGLLETAGAGGLNFSSSHASGSYGWYINGDNKYMSLTATGLSVTGTVTPSADNTYSCGTGALRWSVVYAATGTINTSDAREKTAVSPMTATEVEASKQLAREIGTYKWLSAVAEKGEAARKHVGFTVQRAIEIMQANGLDPMAYGFICYDSWDDEFVEHPAIEAKDAVLNDDGEVIEPAVEAKAAWTEQTQKAGDRYSFRYDELNLFIARGFEARLSALEA